MRALVVGGTGPTGPFIVGGLRDRGYEVTVFHRGTHEIDDPRVDVEHIHGDPHFEETIVEALGDRTYDLVVATYGRVRLLAEHFVGRCGRFVSVGGFPVYNGFWNPFDLTPAGQTVPVPEEGSVAGPDDNRFSYLIRQTEEAVLAAHPDAAHFRYPYVYGPHQVSPREWSIVRRIIDGRPYVIVPDGGHSLTTRGFSANCAHALLLAVDHPDESAGQVYNCGDEVQYSVRQWVELIASVMDSELVPLGLPYEIAGHGDPLLVEGKGFHRVLDLDKSRRELGYHDVVDVPSGVEATVRWLLDNRPDPGGYVETHIGDTFDYEAEDRLVAAYQSAVEELVPLAVEREDGYRPHSYAHPKEPGLAKDHHSR